MKNPDGVDPDDGMLPEYDFSEAEVGKYAERYESAELLNDIRVAEEQIARGEGVEHDVARREILARLCGRR
jgi:hypothetical protein